MMPTSFRTLRYDDINSCLLYLNCFCPRMHLRSHQNPLPVKTLYIWRGRTKRNGDEKWGSLNCCLKQVRSTFYGPYHQTNTKTSLISATSNICLSHYQFYGLFTTNANYTKSTRCRYCTRQSPSSYPRHR